jgi:predicted permease
MFQDLALACRRLRHAPAFTAVAVLTLALTIGANTAIFAIADAVLFRPLPYSDPGRVHVLMTRDPHTGRHLSSVPFAYLQAIDEYHRGLGEVGLRGPVTMTVHAGVDGAEWMEAIAVTPGYLRVLGVQPVRGRLLDVTDQPGRAAVITHESWQRRFGGDEQIIGRSESLGSEPRDIVGVLPPGFMVPAAALNFLYSAAGRPEFLTRGAPPGVSSDSDVPGVVTGGLSDEAVVRLEPGVTLEQAQAEIDALLAPLREGRLDHVVLVSPRAVLFPTGRPMMVFLVAAAALVLLMGCAHLANMLLARHRSRERELGVHAALGATRLRIVRPILLEALIVGTTAAALAVLTTALTFDLLLRQVPPIAYGSAPVGVDVRVAVFAVTLGVLAGVAFAVVPAWSARLDVQTLLTGRSGAGRSGYTAFAYPMVAMQVALAIVLVFGAVIAGRAFVSILRVPLGFSPENLVAIHVQPNPFTTPDLRGFYTRAIEALERRGDVQAAGAGGSVPTDGFRRAEVVDLSGDQRPVDVLYALPGYLEAVGMSLVRGRRLTWTDVADANVAVMSESAARALFRNEDALGAAFTTRQGRQFTVVGVVSDVQRSLGRELDPPAYVIPPPDMTRAMTLVARMRGRGPRALDEMRREIGRLTPDAAVTAVWWADAINALTEYRNPRFQILVASRASRASRAERGKRHRANRGLTGQGLRGNGISRAGPWLV